MGFVFGQHDGPPAPFSVSYTTLSASTGAVSWARQARSASAISSVRFTYGSRTGTPPTYLLRIEALDASGNPDGTDIGGGSPTETTFTPPASTAWNVTTQTITLANSWTPTAGQLFAIVIRYSSGTINASNCSSFAVAATGHDPTSRGFPYYATTTDGSTWNKNGAGIVSWVEGSALVGTPMQSIYNTVTANTSGHRSAAYFTLPSSLGATYDIQGVDIAGKAGTVGGTCTLKLWDSSFNVLKSVTIDADTASSPATTYTARKVFFSSAYTASFGTKYYIGYECDGTGTVGTTGIQCNATDEVAAYPNGENMGIVTWNGTTKTETATIYPCINLWVDNITSASGAVRVPNVILANAVVF